MAALKSLAMNSLEDIFFTILLTDNFSYCHYGHR